MEKQLQAWKSHCGRANQKLDAEKEEVQRLKDLGAGLEDDKALLEHKVKALTRDVQHWKQRAEFLEGQVLSRQIQDDDPAYSVKEECCHLQRICQEFHTLNMQGEERIKELEQMNRGLVMRIEALTSSIDTEA